MKRKKFSRFLAAVLTASLIFQQAGITTIADETEMTLQSETAAEVTLSDETENRRHRQRQQLRQVFWRAARRPPGLKKQRQ